jgi:mandelate racemase
MQFQMPDAASQSILKIRSATARILKVPLRFTLGTSADVVSAVPMVLVEIDTDEGVVGRSYAFAYTHAGAKAIASIVIEAVELVRGSAAAPLPVGDMLARRYRLVGVTGIVRMALSVIDIALWDAQAISSRVPLATALGVSPRPIAAYDSRGLGLMDPGPLADEALRLVSDRKLAAVKLRLGYPTLREDVAAVEAVLRVLPQGVGLMVDYNQALAPDDALRRGKALDEYNLLWIEEPMRHDDYASYSQLAASIRIPLQIGENFNGPAAMKTALTFKACDYAMPDVARIGGVTGWLQAALLASEDEVPISSHLYPEISLPLLAASQTAHWLEYVDWGDAFLINPLQIIDGAAAPSGEPGIGLAWDEKRIATLRIG